MKYGVSFHASDASNCTKFASYRTTTQKPQELEHKTREGTQIMTKPEVLVIDDDKLVADTLVMVLRVNGFEANAVYSGEAGVEFAKNRSFEILLIDVVMNPMNGIETAIEIRKLLPNCKILLFSGNINTGALLADALSHGYEFEILAKPVHPTVLIEALRSFTTA
jgi:CheY-like chemotaxis protein